nr:ribonuclease H-like domain, reverse transcriptase, RNA-dependent DNA polymerase [Tanacetum cinerariifolium]
MKAIRQVLRCVKGTKDYGITFKHNEGNKIQGFSDSSYGVNTQEGKGTSGIIFYYGDKCDEKEKEMNQEFGHIYDWIKKRLGDKVAILQILNRLKASPCVLVSGKFGWSVNMER